jgi:oligopeptide transport system substrate-binding protein
VSVAKDGIRLDRSDTYWNRSAVGLEGVRLVPMDSAEAALDAYKKGELDAVTNADFEPLALKLLTPYQDFKQTTHAALNYYEFNIAVFPFSERRVREALALAIDRDRLTDVEMEGSTEPATRLLPTGSGQVQLLYDADKARDLLDKVGFPSGEGFPRIRLVVNRNDTQQRVAKAIARMWKQNLNLDTQILVKENAEMDAVRGSGDFDLIRRGAVLPSSDELVGLSTVLGSVVRTVPAASATPIEGEKRKEQGGPSAPVEEAPPTMVVITEADALYELNVIPLYFPTSYSMVKPYVTGFEIDANGSPDLKAVSIDSSWRPKK